MYGLKQQNIVDNMALWMDNSSVVKCSSSPNYDGADSGDAFFETAADAGAIYDNDDFESGFFNFKSKAEIYTPPHDSFESNLFDSFPALKQELTSATHDDDTLFGESSFVSDLANFVKVEPVNDPSRSSTPEFPINMFDLNDIDVDQQQQQQFNNNPFDIDMKPLENMFMSADDSSFNDFGNVSLEDFGLNNVKDDFNFSKSVMSPEEEKLLNEFCLDYLFRNDDVNTGFESPDDAASTSLKTKEEHHYSAAKLDCPDTAYRPAAPLINSHAVIKEEPPAVEDLDDDADTFFDVNDQINWLPATTAALPKVTAAVTISSNGNDKLFSDAGATNKENGCGSVLLSKVVAGNAIGVAARPPLNRHQKVTVVVNKNARSILAANGANGGVGNAASDGKSFQRVVICSKKPQHHLSAASGIKSVSGKIVIQKPQSDTASEKTLYIPRQNGRQAPAGFVTVSVLSKEFGRQVLSVRNNGPKSEQQQQQQSPKRITVIPKKRRSNEELVRPETPQSLVGSDDETSAQMRHGPVKTVLKSFASRKYYNSEDDGLTGESYKCLPPAEVTGQFQPKMSVHVKSDADLKLFNNRKLSPMIDCSDDLSSDGTTNSSSSSNGSSVKSGPELLSDLDGNNPLVSFYQKTILNDAPSSPTKSMELLYNKNAASIDHDYGYSSSSNNSQLYGSSYRLNTDSLGIQTPSASEPPTDDSEDDSDGSSDRSQYNRISLKYRRCIDTLNGKRREIIKCMPASPKRNRKRRHSPSPDYDDFSNIYCKSDSSSSPEKMYPSVEGGAGNGGTAKSNQKSHLISSSRIGNNGLRLRITTSTTAAMVNSMKAISDIHQVSSPNPQKRKYRKSAANSAGGGSAGSGSKSFTPIERMMHNTNEQVRRVEMRKSFDKLKQMVPNLREKVKAPKVHILQEAKQYCSQLYYEDLKYASRIEALTLLQEKLRANLSRLRKSAAASRGCIAPA